MLPGTRLGAFEVIAPLGSGGMGDVYRARDVKLGREVALKVLPASFTQDAERVARFQREAQILASLKHPNIATIHGIEQTDGTPLLVLELVEGQTLADVLASAADVGNRGLPTDEALAIARQIADALEAAHEKGVVHRDLKPANIVVSGDGRVKVLDFGLAKAIDPGSSVDMTHSPTITFAATQAGVILGTAAYMSPEQAKGRSVDKRSDVWAFGCVLFEMLAGRRAFDGEDVTDTIAAVVRGEPDWSALPAGVPDQVRLLIRRCLDKDRRTRIADIAVARFLMTETIGVAAAAPAPARKRAAARFALIGAVAGVVAGAVLTEAAVWLLYGRTAPPPARVMRFSLVPSTTQQVAIQLADRNVDIAPDGSFIVYRGGPSSRPQLFVRSLNDVEARALPGTVNARAPFISADSRWVGFSADQELRKVPVDGGPVSRLCRLPANLRGAHWGADGMIVFATTEIPVGLMTVSENGGEPKTLIKPVEGERSYSHPFVLPKGAGILFAIGSPGASPDVVDAGQIAVLDLKSRQHRVLIRGGSNPQYINGYLVYGNAGSLRAARFDPDRLALAGDSVPVTDNVLLSPSTGATNYGVSRSGALVYVPAEAGNFGALPRSIVWVARNGREEALRLPSRPYESVRISPDGTRFVVGIRDAQHDVWIGDLLRQTLTRLTFDPTTDQAPIWTPDGRRIVWSSQRAGGTPNVFMQSADVTGSVERLNASTKPTFPTSMSPDGQRIIAWENNPVTRQDVVVIELDAQAASGPRDARPLVHSPAVEVGGEISPDGRWLAYESDESGRPDVFVRPFPNVDAGRWHISPDGGTRPAWSRSGRELFYLDANGLLTSVAVASTGSAFTAANPVRVFTTKYYAGFTELGLNLRGYDVSPDGQRFLMLKEAPIERSTQPVGMVVVLNWLEELKARVAGR